MKKVLICSPSNTLYGGVENLIGNLCRNLPARGWESLLALGKGARFNDVDRFRSVYPDLPILEIDGVKGTKQARREALIRLIQKVKPDVVVSARIYELCEVIAELKRRGRGPRLVYAVRAYEAPYIYDVGQYRQVIDACVTAGELIAAACHILGGIPSARVVSIPGGIRPISGPALPRVPRGTMRLGYVGRLDPGQKRIFDLLPFLAALDRRRISYRFDIIGTGPAEENLIRQATPWLHSGRVQFHGWQDQESMAHRFFPDMDCLVHFAEFEGVPNAPREAMVHGVVPVVSRFIGLASERQFRHGENSLLFPVGDTECAAEQISRLATDPGLLTSLSRAAMSSQSGKYSFDGAMDIWAETLDRCLELPLRNGPIPRRNLSDKGFLGRMGLSPWLAQRVRDILGMKPAYRDLGSEWPTSSGLITGDAWEKIMTFATEYDLLMEKAEGDPEGAIAMVSEKFGMDTARNCL